MMFGTQMAHKHTGTCLVTIDGFWIDDWVYCTFIHLVTTVNYSALANSHTILWHTLSLLCHHWVLPGNRSQQCPLLPCSTAPILAGWRRCHEPLYSLLSRAIPHASRTALPNRRLKLYCFGHGLLARAQDLLSADPLPPNCRLLTDCHVNKSKLSDGGMF
jgi:hypothetical protein